MTAKIETPESDHAVHDTPIEAMRSLIDQRRAGPFVDLDEGEAEIRTALAQKKARRAP